MKQETKIKLVFGTLELFGFILIASQSFKAAVGVFLVTFCMHIRHVRYFHRGRIC